MGFQSFSYTGAWQQFKVPKGVKSIGVTLEGGGSGAVNAGRVSGRITVVPGQMLYLMVGRRGRSNVGDTGGAEVFGGGAAGGNGRGNSGGWSGGGASAIRLGSATGRVLVAVGGAGGQSGDGGQGGEGGSNTGSAGTPGAPAPGAVANATGGTAIQGGNGGTSALGVSYSGQNASDAVLVVGGAGGSVDVPASYGGGGGGGGYHPGGGGQAGTFALASAGGGGGGSSYRLGLSNWSDRLGGGGSGNGSIELSWVDPAPANQPPSPPTDIKVVGKAAEDGQSTYSTGQVSISAVVDDPSANQTVRLVARYSVSADFSGAVGVARSTYVKQTKRATLTLNGLSQDTHYYVRLYTQDSRSATSINYTSVNFWTNRKPLQPDLVTPVDGATVLQLASVVFQWTHHDPDSDTAAQKAFQLRSRLASTPLVGSSDWTTVEFTTAFSTYVADPGTFKANLVYEWQVRTQDEQNAWGPWSVSSTFFVSGQALAPLPLAPTRHEAITVTVPVVFEWQFRDPDPGDFQSKADLRWRAVGTNDWNTEVGDTLVPGSTMQWALPAGTFTAGVHYEYQVRTTDTLSAAVSDWSESEFFWGTGTPGAAVSGPVVVPLIVPRPGLGTGHHRAFIYDRGGTIPRGEVKSLQNISWLRKRDEIGNVVLQTNGFEDPEFLKSIHSWRHEVVVYRDDERVFEGPVTRKTDYGTYLEIEAKDVMGYVYRRIMRQGYDDSYHIINCVVQGDFTIVQRAAKIIANALAPDDPNVLPYLTTMDYSDDAAESRVVPPFTKTAWEEIDDMAANAGLDYVTVGRRIILNDTHRPVGRLPQMRTKDFSDPPVISEYGMSFANAYGVTNGNGIWGLAMRNVGSEGLVELLASAYGETDATSDEVLTPEARLALEQTLDSQAERNIGGRYPVPVQVRVPDNSSLSPAANVGINDLVPGVWIPLHAQGGCLEASQWQKLDSVAVTEDEHGEKVSIAMSPAPNAGQDPDADQSDVEDQ